MGGVIGEEVDTGVRGARSMSSLPFFTGYLLPMIHNSLIKCHEIIFFRKKYEGNDQPFEGNDETFERCDVSFEGNGVPFEGNDVR